MKKLNLTACLSCLLILCVTTICHGDYVLVDTIQLEGKVDILGLANSGEHIILHSNSLDPDENDFIQIYDTSFNVLNEFAAGSRYTDGCAWNGGRIVYSQGADVYNRSFYEMDMNGTIYGPLHYLGTSKEMCIYNDRLYMVTDAYSPSDGGLIIDVLNADTYSYLETILVPYEDEHSITSWIGGIAWANDEFYVAFGRYDKIVRFDSNFNVIDELEVVDAVHGITVIDDYLYVGDRASWTSDIDQDYSHIRIYRIPEPATVSLLAVGGLVLLRKRK